jgi:hypothetical protein
LPISVYYGIVDVISVVGVSIEAGKVDVSAKEVNVFPVSAGVDDNSVTVGGKVYCLLDRADAMFSFWIDNPGVLRKKGVKKESK